MKSLLLKPFERYLLAFFWITERLFLPLYKVVLYPYKKFWESVIGKINRSRLLNRLEKNSPKGLFFVVTASLILVCFGMCYFSTLSIFYTLNRGLTLDRNVWSITHDFLLGLFFTYMFVETFSKPHEKTFLESEEEYRQYLQDNPVKEKQVFLLAIWMHVFVLILPIAWFFR